MPRDFVTLVTELNWLPRAVAAELRTEGDQLTRSPVALARQKGLLSAEQTEIMETLLSPDEAFPGYEIQSLLGMGGMGAVFRARQKTLDRLVALKTVLLSRGVAETALQRFEQEAVALAKIVHPHVVAAYDFGKHRETLFLALELVEGENLEQYSQRIGPLAEEVTWQFIRQTAAGLAHAAELGIVHRDIKPANLLLVSPPAGFPLPPGIPLVKITDFGLALITAEIDERTRLTSAGTTLGSPNYMSPEQLSGETVDHRTDIYALGATAYHLLAGAPPFRGLNLSALVGKKLSTGPEPLEEVQPGVSAGTLALVRRMLALKTSERPNNYRELLAEIDQLLATQLSTVPSSTPTQIASLPTQELNATTIPMPVPARSRRSVLMVAILAVMASALFAAGGSWWLRRNVPEQLTAEVGDYRSVDYGPEVSLFTGAELTGWGGLSGEWKPTKDDEGAWVLAGSRGSATRGIAWDSAPPAAEVEFRVTFVVQRRDAQSIRVEFDAVPATHESAQLFLQNDTLAVGHLRQGTVLRERRLPYDKSTFVVQLVRQAKTWLVLIDEQPVARLPRLADHSAPRLQLTVTGGPAWFSDFSVAPRRE